MTKRTDYKKNKGSLVVESAIVIPVCLFLTCFGIVLLLLQYQRSVGYGAAAGAALAASANWGDSRRDLESGSWIAEQEPDGLYEILSMANVTNLSALFNIGSTERTMTVDYEELRTEEAGMRAIYDDESSTFAEAVHARIFEYLMIRMRTSMLAPEEIILSIGQSPSFPETILSVTVTQRFDLPFIGRLDIRNSAKSAACGPADFLEGTDFMIEIINRYLPFLKQAAEKEGQ